MRKFYTYFIAFIIALLTFSCTNDLAELPAEDLPLADPKDCIIGISPQIEPGEEGLTRSSLTFSPTLRAMTFAWDATDALGVYPINATNISTAQQKFSINANDINGLSAIFSNADTDINSITSGQRYVAYSPFTAVDEDKNVIHVTYRNQIQKESVNMDAYYKRSQSDEQMQAYLASEKEASAHLGKYDYMVSAATAPEHGNMSFKFTRLGSIVRFYLRIPAEGFYDSIQVINKDAAFILDADMDITKTNSSEAFTNPVTSHIVSLSFQKEKKEEGGNVSHSGFDLTDTPDNHYYGTPSSGRRGYIIAYMMFAPINLNTANIGKSTLYLLGHYKNSNKKYYRATDKLTKINIAQNKTQQWAPATLELDEPIDFVPVEVEIWKNDTNFDNDGTGTDDW